MKNNSAGFYVSLVYAGNNWIIFFLIPPTRKVVVFVVVEKNIRVGGNLSERTFANFTGAGIVFPSGNAEKLNCNKKERERERRVVSLLFETHTRAASPPFVPRRPRRTSSSSSPSLDPFRERRARGKTRLVTLAPLHPPLRHRVYFFLLLPSLFYSTPAGASQKLPPPFFLPFSSLWRTWPARFCSSISPSFFEQRLLEVCSFI